MTNGRTQSLPFCATRHVEGTFLGMRGDSPSFLGKRGAVLPGSHTAEPSKEASEMSRVAEARLAGDLQDLDVGLLQEFASGVELDPLEDLPVAGARASQLPLERANARAGETRGVVERRGPLGEIGAQDLNERAAQIARRLITSLRPRSRLS